MARRKRSERDDHHNEEEEEEEEETDAESENMASVGAMEEQQKEHDRFDREYFDRFPQGFRFKPTAEELIVHYLGKKVLNLKLPPNRIRDINLYNYHPAQLTAMYKLHREKEWYFFTPREKKYPNGYRPNRAAGNGYWKATGADTKILSKGVEVGKKKSLVYYEGKAREPENVKKTEWIMHEYKVHQEKEKDNKNAGNGSTKSSDPNDKKLDKWVLCMVYKKDRSNQEQNRRRNVPNVLMEAENNTSVSVEAPQEESSHGDGVDNVPVFHEQVSSQNQVRRTHFSHSANAHVVNYEQFPSQNQVQWPHFNHSANAQLFDYEQFLSQNQVQRLPENYSANAPRVNYGQNPRLPPNNYSANSPLVHYPQIPTQNLVQRSSFSHNSANINEVNQQVLNPTPVHQLIQSNPRCTRFPPQAPVRNNQQFGSPLSISPYRTYNMPNNAPVLNELAPRHNDQVQNNLVSRHNGQVQNDLPPRHNGPVQNELVSRNDGHLLKELGPRHNGPVRNELLPGHNSPVRDELVPRQSPVQWPYILPYPYGELAEMLQDYPPPLDYEGDLNYQTD